MPLKKIRTILVAVADSSSPMKPLLERAAQLADAFGAHVVLFHAAFDASLAGWSLLGSRRLAKARGAMVADRTQQLERHAAALRGRGISSEARVVWQEPAHEAVVRAAIRENAGLVIAGSHQTPGRSSALKLTDWELLRLCSRPLLLIRSTCAAPASGAVLAALDPTHSGDKPASLDASLAMHGALIADALGADFHAVHCVPRTAYGLTETGPADRKRMRERMYSKLQKVLERSDVTARKIHVLDGEVETVLPQLARELRAQVLVLGAISRRGIERFAIGNTAERIIHDAPCDLLIVKPENFRLRLGRVREQALILPPQMKKPRAQITGRTGRRRA